MSDDMELFLKKRGVHVGKGNTSTRFKVDEGTLNYCPRDYRGHSWKDRKFDRETKLWYDRCSKCETDRYFSTSTGYILLVNGISIYENHPHLRPKVS
jgi:hypothetical protein